MSRVSSTMVSGVIVALIGVVGMASPSFAAGKKMHGKHMAMRHHRTGVNYARQGTSNLGTRPMASVHNGTGSPFSDGDIFGGTGPARSQTAAAYGSGGLFGGGGVLGTGVLNGQGAFGVGAFGL